MRKFIEITDKPGAPVEARCKDDNNIYIVIFGCKRGIHPFFER